MAQIRSRGCREYRRMAHKLRRNGYLSVECLETSPALDPVSSLTLLLNIVEMDETRCVTRLSRRTRLTYHFAYCSSQWAHLAAVVLRATPSGAFARSPIPITGTFIVGYPCQTLGFHFIRFLWRNSQSLRGLPYATFKLRRDSCWIALYRSAYGMVPPRAMLKRPNDAL